MRALITFLAVAVCGLLLVLWFSHSTAPASVRPARADGPAEARQEPVKLADALTPAAAEAVTARVASSTDSGVAPVAASGPQCRVFGRVTDEHGAPLADVVVSLYPVNGRWSDTTTIGLIGAEGARHEGFVQRSARDGRFEFNAPLPTSDWVTLEADGGIYRSLVERRFGPKTYGGKPRLVEGDNEVGDLRLSPAGAVRGRVVSTTGAPIPGAWVYVADFSVSAQEVGARADERGEFLVGHAPLGRQSAQAEARGWIDGGKQDVDVVVLQTVAVQDIVLAPAFTISGTVVDEEGRPAADVSVHATTSNDRRFSARANQAGEFTLYADVEGTCTLEVPASQDFEAWSSADSKYDTGAKDVRIVLRRNAEFTFHVVDAHTREPIERYGLRLEAKTAAGFGTVASEADIQLVDHPNGDARAHKREHVIARAPDHAPFEGDVLPDPDRPEVQTIALIRPSAIRGRLALAGRACPKCTVTLCREGIDAKREFKHPPGASSGGLRYDVGAWVGRKREKTSAADGSFAFAELAAGTYALQIEGPGVARKLLRGLEVPAENALDVGEILLDPGAVIRGVIVTEPGSSAEGFHVRLGFDHSRNKTIDNVDGKFEFQGLEAGEYKLTWGRPAQTSWSSNDPHIQTIQLVAGEVRDVVIDASASTPCTVVVHVTRSGKPAEGVSVWTRVQGAAKSGWTSSKLGACDASGTAVGEVDGDAVFDLEAATDAGNPICFLAKGLRAEPGGRVERTIEMQTGRLTIELPATMAMPEKGLVRAVLEAPDREQWSVTATTAGAPSSYRGNVAWSGPTIAGGELGVGPYDATVWVQRLDPDPDRPGRAKPVDLREPYKTKVVIEADREAKIVVP